MSGVPNKYRGLTFSAFLLLTLAGFTAARAADNFFFPAANNPPAGSYQVTNIQQFVINARTGGVLDATFNHVVTVGLYNTVNPNPPTQLGDPGVTIVGNLGTFTGTGPVSFNGGAVTFTLNFRTGSDSEQVYVKDSGGSPITSGDSYPGVFAGAIGGAGITVQGFSTAYYLGTASGTSQPAAYAAGTTQYDFLTADATTIGNMGSTFLDVGVTINLAGGTTGNTGIDTVADAFAVTNISGGYAAGAASILNNMFFKRSNTLSSPAIQAQVIIDYNGTLTDFNNPVTAADTVYSFTGNVLSTNYTTTSFTGGPVGNSLPFQQFMNNGQIIVRIWNTTAGNPVLMRWASNGGTAKLSNVFIPYSSGNIQPVRGTVSPTLYGDNQPANLVYTLNNQFSSPVTDVLLQIPPNSPVAGTPFNFSSISGPAGSSPVITSNPTAGGAPGTITVNFSTPLAPNATASITLTGTASSQTGSYPISMLSVMNANSGLPAPADPNAATVQTLGIPNIPPSFTASPVSFNNGGGSVSLSWGQVTNESSQGYVITRNPGTGNFANPVVLPSGTVVNNAVTLMPSSATSYVDSTAPNLSGCTYTIQAFNDILQSSTAGVGPVTAFANPGPPGSVAALTGGTHIQLSWAAPASVGGSYPVTGYQIYRGTSPNGENTAPLAAVTTNLSPVTYLDTPPVAPGTTYYYYLSSIDNQYGGGPTLGAHDSGPSAEASGFPPGNPPSINIPTLLSSSPATIQVTWTPPSNVLNTPLSNYYLYRAVTTGSFAAYATVGGGVLTYNDTAVTAGSYYSYEVQAVDSLAVTSNLSAAVTGRVGPPSPAMPTVFPSTTGVTLVWPAVANSTGETIVNYVVYRNSTAIASPVTTASASLTYTDSGITLGTDYFYQVAAEDQASVIGGLSGGVSSALLPPAPSSLAVSLVLSNDNVAVTWATPVPTETNLQSYTLTQALNAGAPSVIANPAASAVSYYDASVTPANAGQTVTYKLSAKNDVGGVGLQTAVSLVVPPNAPAGLAATASASAITLNWTGLLGQGVTQYTVSRVVNPGPVTTVVGSTASGAVSTLTDNSVALAEGTNYVYFVTAKNAGGYGLNSTSVTSALLPLVPASLTAAVSATGTQFNVGVTWSAPVSSGNLTGYNLIRNNAPTLAGATTVVLGGAPGTTNDADTLALGTAGTTIFYFTQGVNPGGAGPTIMAGFQVPPNPPGAPVPKVSATAITLTWTANNPLGNNSNYTLYRINPGPTVVTIGSTGSGAVTTLTDTGSVSPLAQGVTYQYFVTATNPGGGVGVPGGTSLASVTVSSGLAAPAPTGLQVSSIDTSNNIALAWTNVTGAAPNATGVTLFGGTTGVLGSATPVPLATPVVSFNDNGVFSGSVTGEKPDTTYYYWLETVNPFGPSAPAGPVSQLTYPAAVSLDTVVLNSDGSRAVSWTTVGSGDVTSYNIYREQVGGSGFVSVGSASASGLNLPVTLSNPTLPGKQYIYKVTAVNGTGEGTNQDFVTIGVPPSVPSPVTALTGLSTSAAVSLSWPANAAGEGVTGYSVYRGTGANPNFSTASPIATGLTLTTYLDNTGLLGGTTYYYWVEAQDGDGVFSLPTSFTSPVTIVAAAQPNAPTGLTETDGNASAALTWTAAVSTTFPVTGYNLYDSANGGATVKANATPVAAPPAVVPGLANGVSYNLWVQAVDSQGNLSPLDGPVTGLPAAAPALPVNVGASPGNNQNQISWLPGVAPGGSLPVSYFLVRRVAPGPVTTTFQQPASFTGYLDSPTVNGTVYTYSVEAVDNSGVTTGTHVSGFSASVSVTTGQITINPASNVSALGAPSQVVLKWTDSTGSTLSTPVTGYQIYRATAAAGPYSVLNTAATVASQPNSYTDSVGVANGTTYYYYLVSVASGTTTVSGSATVFGTAAGAPAAPSPVSLLDGGQENLSWAASPNQGAVTILNYYIERSVNGGATAPLASTTGPATTYTDSTASIGQTVAYQVGAVNSNGTTGALSPAITGYLYTPMTITGLSSTDTTSAVTLSWTGVGAPTWGPVQYNILRTTLTGSSPTTILNVTSPYPDTTGTLGQLYLYTVTAVDAKGHASVGGGPVTDGPLNPPAAPTTVVPTAGNQQVLFDWAPSAPVSGSLPVSSYLVSVNGGAPFSLPATVTSYLDSGLVNGTAVSVVVRAVDATGNPVGNHISAPVTGGPVVANGLLLNPPTGAAVTAAGGTTNVLTWNRPNDEGFIVTGYNIYRSTVFTPTLGSLIATVPNPALNPVTVFTDNGVSANTTYFYVITANYQQGAAIVASPPSNHAWDTTPAPQAGVPPVTPGQMAFDANLLKPLTGQVLNIYFIAPNSGQAEIDVYNVAGNPIRALFATAAAGAQESLAWDGKDRNGNTVASGIYLVEIKGPGIHLVRKVLVVK